MSEKLVKNQTIHFIGIGGAGLSAMARVLHENGYRVTGSDRAHSPIYDNLAALGLILYEGHDPRNIHEADIVVRSSAVPDDNVEVQAAYAAGIPVLKREQFLREMLTGKRCIAIAGTHGKTTTTAMIAWMLRELDQDPSYIIGSVSINLGSNGGAGKSDWFVIEADEYDKMFYGLEPEIAIITNIEHDHPDQYPTYEDMFRVFIGFTERLVSGGFLVACADDPGALRLVSYANEKNWSSKTYGMHGSTWDYQIGELLCKQNGCYQFSLMINQPDDSMAVSYKVVLEVPGLHNVYNATAALAVSHLLKLSVPDACNAINKFLGTNRRFDIRGEVAGISVIDDYAHHPTEIRATLSAARLRYPGRKIWTVWQPHTYSRVRALLDQFSTCFIDADYLIVTDIFAAREYPPSDGFSIQDVVNNIKHPEIRYIAELSSVYQYLCENLQIGDVLCVLSAGDADQVSSAVLESLAQRGPVNAV